MRHPEFSNREDSGCLMFVVNIQQYFKLFFFSTTSKTSDKTFNTCESCDCKNQ